MGDGADDEWDPTEQELAEARRARQDVNAGLTYTLLAGDAEDIGSWRRRCDRCRRVGSLLERPFPHKLACPMRRR